MNGTPPHGLTFLAKLVIVVAGILVLSGVIWHGVTLEAFQRIWRDLFERPGGPMTFRFILQPTMAFIAALHDGIYDARLGRSPYFWTVLHRHDERMARLNEGLISTARIILLGIVMDAIYQYRVLGAFYQVEALLIALALAFVPYLLLRGAVTRIARWWFVRKSAGSAP